MPLAACGADPIVRERHCHCIFRTEEYVDVNIEDIRLLPRHVARRTRNMRGEVFVACHETPYISKPYPYISNGFFATTRNHSILATILDAGGRRRIGRGTSSTCSLTDNTGAFNLCWRTS